ncbi:MAG: class I SAM-dependent methyltransferase [Solirubrobacteraceae bacterium]
MPEPTFATEQRLAFGRVAELYDRARPSYPAAAVDAVIAFASLTAGSRILEVGAGTGKATALFAARGLGVLALEPNADMARLARINCARYPAVEVVETEFERWTPGVELPAVVSAAAWHWIAPDRRYEKASRALVPGGALAAIWTFPDWEDCALRAPLSAAYRTAPQLAPDFPMHPDSRPTRLAGEWEADIASSPWFTAPAVRTFPWRQKYTGRQYVDLVQTHQDHILLADAPRAELLRAILRTIDDCGGAFEMPFVTRVCLAVRSLTSL